MFLTQLEKLSKQVLRTDLSAGFETLQRLPHQTLQSMNQGDLPRWQTAFNALPDLTVDRVDLDVPAVTIEGHCTRQQSRQLKASLEELIPWRKGDRKSTRLNSSHVKISYAVFCLKKKSKAI